MRHPVAEKGHSSLLVQTWVSAHAGGFPVSLGLSGFTGVVMKVQV